MKKYIFTILAILMLTGCGSENEKSISDYEKAFSDAGLELKDKPMYDLIGAEDGVMFYNDGKKVAIYKFKSQKDIEKAEENLPDMKNWERKGLIVLETSDEEAKKIFKEQ